jgi:hypothetical protein
MHGLAWLAEKQLASQEGQCLDESVGSLLFMNALIFLNYCLGFKFQEINKCLVSDIYF